MPESINKKLAEKAVLQALKDARYTTGQRKSIMKQLSGTVDSLVAELSKLTGLDTSKSPRKRKRIISAFLQDAEQIIEKDFKAFEKSFTSEMSSYAVYESEAAAKTVNTAVGVDLVSKTLTDKQAAALVSEAWIANRTVNEYFKGMQESMKADLFSTMRRGYLTGESTESLIRKIRGYVDAEGIQHTALIDGATRKSAERAVRTMVMGIANEARHKTLVEDADVVKGFQWVATLDGRTCADCASRDGLAWDLDGNGLDGNTIPYETPPLHASCVTGDTLVSPIGRISAASKRWVEGEIIIIKTASNNILTCTPNHPILTNKGWVRASEVDKVGNVISYFIGQGVGRGDGNIDQVPTSIEDITSSLFSSSAVMAMPVPVSSEDFHGDKLNSEVAIIGANRELLDTVNTAFLKHVRQFNFVARNGSRFSDKTAPCNNALLKGGHFSAPCRVMGVLGQKVFLLLRHIIHAGLLLFFTPTERDISHLKEAGDSLPGVSKFIGDTLDSNTAVIHFKCGVVIKRLFAFATNRLNSILFKKCVDCLGVNSKHIGNLGDRHLVGVIGDEHLGYVNLYSTSCSGRAQFFQEAVNSSGRNVIFCAEFGDGSSIPVIIDNILSTTPQKFTGHVYNLQSSSGAYLASNIITHNCRCTLTPLLKSWEELGMDLPEFDPSTRASMDGQVSDTLDFKEWFDSKGAAFQAKWLGPGRYELWQKGKITFRDLVDQNGRELTLAQLKELVDD